MPIPSVNSPSLTVNSVLVQEVLVSGSIDTTAKLRVSARAGTLPAVCQTDTDGNQTWTIAGDRQTVFIPGRVEPGRRPFHRGFGRHCNHSSILPLSAWSQPSEQSTKPGNSCKVAPRGGWL